jgi:altronate dehydratase small subunit
LSPLPPGNDREMRQTTKAIVIHEKDTVATALEPLRAGSEIPVAIQNHTEKIKLVDEIPAGHKFALIDMEAGTDIIKYGEPIGQSTAKIARGEHIHRHNMTSRTKQGSGQ